MICHNADHPDTTVVVDRALKKLIYHNADHPDTTVVVDRALKKLIYHNADHPDTTVMVDWVLKNPVIYHNADQSALLEFVHVHVTCGVMPISMLYGKVRCNNTGIIIMPTAIK